MTNYEFYYFLSDMCWVLTLISLFVIYYFVDRTPIDSSASRRVLRLIGAIAFLYIATVVSMVLHYEFERFGLYAYFDKFPDCSLRPCDGERQIGNSGANLVFYYYFGWLPALVIVGLCELHWRYRHRAEVGFLEARDAGYIFSTAIIFLAISLILILLISWL